MTHPKKGSSSAPAAPVASLLRDPEQPKARSRRRARTARTDPKRYRLTLLGQALLEATDARGRASTDTEHAAQNRRVLAQLRALNNALIAAGLHRPANSNAGEATSSTGRADQAAPRPLPPLHK